LKITHEQGRVTIVDLAKITGIRKKTIKDHMAFLHKNRYIELRGADHGTWYSLI